MFLTKKSMVFAVFILLLMQFDKTKTRSLIKNKSEKPQQNGTTFIHKHWRPHLHSDGHNLKSLNLSQSTLTTNSKLSDYNKPVIRHYNIAEHHRKIHPNYENTKNNQYTDTALDNELRIRELMEELVLRSRMANTVESNYFNKSKTMASRIENEYKNKKENANLNQQSIKSEIKNSINNVQSSRIAATHEFNYNEDQQSRNNDMLDRFLDDALANFQHQHHHEHAMVISKSAENYNENASENSQYKNNGNFYYKKEKPLEVQREKEDIENNDTDLKWKDLKEEELKTIVKSSGDDLTSLELKNKIPLQVMLTKSNQTQHKPLEQAAENKNIFLTQPRKPSTEPSIDYKIDSEKTPNTSVTTAISAQSNTPIATINSSSITPLDGPNTKKKIPEKMNLLNTHINFNNTSKQHQLLSLQPSFKENDNSESKNITATMATKLANNATMQQVQALNLTSNSMVSEERYKIKTKATSTIENFKNNGKNVSISAVINTKDSSPMHISTKIPIPESQQSFKIVVSENPLNETPKPLANLSTTMNMTSNKTETTTAIDENIIHLTENVKEKVKESKADIAAIDTVANRLKAQSKIEGNAQEISGKISTEAFDKIKEEKVITNTPSIVKSNSIKELYQNYSRNNTFFQPTLQENEETLLANTTLGNHNITTTAKKPTEFDIIGEPPIILVRNISEQFQPPIGITENVNSTPKDFKAVDNWKKNTTLNEPVKNTTTNFKETNEYRTKVPLLESSILNVSKSSVMEPSEEKFEKLHPNTSSSMNHSLTVPSGIKLQNQTTEIQNFTITTNEYDMTMVNLTRVHNAAKKPSNAEKPNVDSTKNTTLSSKSTLLIGDKKPQRKRTEPAEIFDLTHLKQTTFNADLESHNSSNFQYNTNVPSVEFQNRVDALIIEALQSNNSALPHIKSSAESTNIKTQHKLAHPEIDNYQDTIESINQSTNKTVIIDKSKEELQEDEPQTIHKEVTTTVNCHTNPETDNTKNNTLLENDNSKATKDFAIKILPGKLIFSITNADPTTALNEQSIHEDNVQFNSLRPGDELQLNKMEVKKHNGNNDNDDSDNKDDDVATADDSDEENYDDMDISIETETTTKKPSIIKMTIAAIDERTQLLKDIAPVTKDQNKTHSTRKDNYNFSNENTELKELWSNDKVGNGDKKKMEEVEALKVSDESGWSGGNSTSAMFSNDDYADADDDFEDLENKTKIENSNLSYSNNEKFHEQFDESETQQTELKMKHQTNVTEIAPYVATSNGNSATTFQSMPTYASNYDPNNEKLTIADGKQHHLITNNSEDEQSTEITATNWWHTLPYAEIRKFLNTIFASESAYELYEEIARKSKEIRNGQHIRETIETMVSGDSTDDEDEKQSRRKLWDITLSDIWNSLW